MVATKDIPMAWSVEKIRDVALRRQLMLLLRDEQPVYELRRICGNYPRALFASQRALDILKNRYLVRFEKRGYLWYVHITELGQEFCRHHKIHAAGDNFR